jgi:UDP-N-acetylmuramoylalanyl-D-glutamate--2,6-diaminopimelate ligase (EC 6.3.2.13)
MTIVGAGGNRDKEKRPLMGLVAAEHSDKVFITSDNPRDEVPELIIGEIYNGVPEHLKKKCLSITDRKEAIRMACMMAKSNDIILVAGKGHENYQEVKGVKYPFDDKEILKQTFLELDK